MQERIAQLLAQLDQKVLQRICSKVDRDDCCEDILQDVCLKIM